MEHLFDVPTLFSFASSNFTAKFIGVSLEKLEKKDNIIKIKEKGKKYLLSVFVMTERV